MGRPLPSTCLSIGHHDNQVSDVVIHYNGCLRVAKQGQFYDSLDLESQQRISRANGKIADLRSRLETSEQASTAGTRLQGFKQAMAEWRAVTGHSNVPAATNLGYSRSQTPRTPAFGADKPVDSHIRASVIYFKDGQPFDVPGLAKSSPHQKIPVADLLSENESKNPIMQPNENGVVRYFHLPANNMAWVEEVIARYYHEKRPDPNIRPDKQRSMRPESKTETVLQPGYWRGQQNFDAGSEVHARHMKPFFSGISVDPRGSGPRPKNMVLFMPYLHWETDRGRARSAEIAKEARKYDLSSIKDVVDQAKNQLARTETQHTVAPAWALRPHSFMSGSIDRRKALGQVLRSAATLLEAMDSHIEEQLTMSYLHAEPPLHPRRTLDQAYYGALRSTGARDRDQVVYRGTTAQPHPCVGPEACPQCNEDIRKTPRILMVDQLWLWCLDEKTIITSFPRRWGRNRPDPSAIHKSLRTRFQHAHPGEISSAYDLALIIVDEASRVFFNRTKISAEQPNLVELFNAAIRDLTYKQTAAFDQFLIYTHLASRDYKRQRYVSSDNSTQNHLLNINPEGELLKEVKDIQDELHIIMRIKEQQQAVMENFVKHIRRTLVPVVRAHRPITSRPSAVWDAVLEASLEYSGASAEDPTYHREEEERQCAQQTLTKADILLEDIEGRIAELRALLQNTQNTSAALKDLLTLKQQQAGVIEAREAVKQAQLTLKQGQSIMIFTVVTIIFLPLSFCASVFGMNATEFSIDARLPLSSELRLMFPISAGIIFASFLFAFSRGVFANSAIVLARSAASFAWNTAATWVAVKTGLYLVSREMLARANRLREKEGTVTGGMKAEVLRREKNLERMRAAGHVKALARQRQSAMRRTEAADGSSEPAGMVLTPFSEGIPSSSSPFLGERYDGMMDVELGERVSRKPSSQIHLVQGR
ncbi:hypothetical protein C7999DRAFT_41176 [Corynascus novoguineensis]|uniref:Uncharacterized protein n=1 Tax=Corynascus novoguineensis TaxID=1126955 RepID=A0AAN7HNN7_9PEZI|nr:hypothetical protein C7999DRAFT_41176 [Corynascus novoguineensis]